MACLAGLLNGGAGLAWATRVDQVTAAAVRERWPEALVDRWPGGLGGHPAPPVGEVLVLTAGTSDGAVAAEVAATLAAAAWGPAGGRRRGGRGAPGAGGRPGHRGGRRGGRGGRHGRRAAQRRRRAHRVVVAVPTSVGYGAAFEGLAALLTMLTACAPGVLVVNIDNGFGAGVAAARIPPPPPSRAHAGSDSER